MPRRRKRSKAGSSATVKIHFDVGRAEAGGYRYFVERRGRLTGGSRRIKIMDTKWYHTRPEAVRGLSGAKRRWSSKLR